MSAWEQAAGRIGAQSEVGAIRRLVLKHARDAFRDEARIEAQWRALNYAARPDLGRAVAEYEAFVAAIRDLAPEVDIRFIPADEVLTLDSLYPRDAAIACARGMILCNMGKPARTAEPAAQAALFESLGIPIHGRIGGAGRVEGGDVAWLDERTLAAGLGYRTNAEGIRQLEALVADCGVEVVTVHLPHYRGPDDVFHLMSIFSPLDRDLALVYSPLMSVAFRQMLLDRGMALVEVPDAEFESMGCNVLAVAPRRCIMLEGNDETRRRLEAAGVEVRLIAGQEICRKGAGGPTCLTRPVWRDRHG